MAVVNLRHMSAEAGAFMLHKIDQLILPFLEKALTDSGNIEPSGVGDLLRSSLSDEIDVLKIGTVFTDYISLGQR